MDNPLKIFLIEAVFSKTPHSSDVLISFIILYTLRVIVIKGCGIMIDLAIGFIFSLIIALAGYVRKSLTVSGAVSAIILGTSLYYFGGVYLSAVLVAFFLSSSILTKISERIRGIINEISEKGGKRDYTQVAANGFLGLIFAFLYYITQDHIFILAYGTALAAANSDTWASEIGVLSKKRPISIISFRPMETGMSGGISFLGTAASVLGSGFIAVILGIGYYLLYGLSYKLLIIFILCAFGGFLGSIIDSIIGATLQAKYRCAVCGKLTEKKVHHDRATELVQGIGFVNNDFVNFMSPLLAALVVVWIYIVVI